MDIQTKGISCQADNVCKIYTTRQGSTTALSRDSLRVEPGEFVSIVGPSGCGKTTLLNIMCGLIAPSDGEVSVDGQPVRAPYTDIGYVFQQDVLLAWRTVFENVILPIEIKMIKPVEHYHQRAYELLEMVGLRGFEKKYPGELSGGMRQRVSICRALLCSPPLLFMDEPFGALDALTREQMNIDLLDIWSANRNTVLFVTHSIDEAVILSDRVIVMSSRPGRIIEDIRIDRPRPRTLQMKGTDGFVDYVSRIREIFDRHGVLHDSGKTGKEAVHEPLDQ